MIIVTAALAVIAVALLLPSLSDLLSVGVALVGRGARAPISAGDAPRVLILMPAHDEELLIGACLTSLGAMEYPRDRFDVVVVADNCANATAARAREHGARCLERSDPVRRGKPWAVAWALEQLSVADWDAVVILDADSLVDPQFLRALARRAPLADKIVQGYINVSNPGESMVTRMARVWSTARFQLVNRLKVAAGLNVPLGDGLCIGTRVLAQHGWSAFSLSETWEVYASMTAAGVRCIGAQDAHLYAQEARTLRQSASQRERWTAGRLAVLRRYGGALVTSRRIGPRQKLDILAELLSLGPAAHLGVAVALAGVAVALPVPGGHYLAGAFLASLARPIIYTVVALARDPDPGRAALAFSFLPLYVVWRLWIQVRSMTGLRNAPWVRTARHHPVPAAGAALAAPAAGVSVDGTKDPARAPADDVTRR